jgi:Trypsin-co-occurring domain 2
MSEGVTVADAIKQLRMQLEDAQREGIGKDLRFQTQSVEVELAIVFRTETEGGAGIKAWFLDISGRATASDEATHRVKLVLKPVDRDGKDIYVSDDIHERN